MSLINLIPGQRPNPTGMTPQEQVQTVAGSRMMPAPITRGTPSFIASRDAVPPQMAPPTANAGPSFGQKISNFFSDEDKVAKLILALEPLRGPGGQGGTAARWAQSHLQTSRETNLLNRQSNKTIEFLRAKGVDPNLLESARGNPSILKALVAKTLESPAKPSAFAEKLAAARQAYPNLSEAELMDRLLAPTSQTTIDLGDDAVSKEYAKQIPETLGQYSDRGAAANRQNSALNNLGRALSGVDTGGFAETKQTVLSFADRLGIPVDTESLANAQQLQAAARQIVADELRQNKGPQTDFDAIFAQTYLPGLGQQPEANENILSYLKSRNLLDSIYGRLSAGRSYEFDSDKNLLSRLNAFNSTLGATVKVDEEWFTFEEFYREAKNRGGSDMDILNEWSKLH